MSALYYINPCDPFGGRMLRPMPVPVWRFDRLVFFCFVFLGAAVGCMQVRTVRMYVASSRARTVLTAGCVLRKTSLGRASDQWAIAHLLCICSYMVVQTHMQCSITCR